MRPEPIEVLVDVISPYAALAVRVLPRALSESGRTAVIKPVLFAALLDAHGTKGPAEVPAKRAYVMLDVWRKARALGLPEPCPPPSHPFNPLLALRVASLPMDEDVRWRLFDAYVRATWWDGTGVESDDTVLACVRAVGLPDTVLADARTPVAKERLRAATNAAIERGVFGVPTLLADGELFWGVDAIPLLVDFLRTGARPPAELLAKWDLSPASARRPGA